MTTRVFRTERMQNDNTRNITDIDHALNLQRNKKIKGLGNLMIIKPKELKKIVSKYVYRARGQPRK